MPDAHAARQRIRLPPEQAAADLHKRELRNPPTIERLAERVGIDKRELTKRFLELFGVTPHRYQLHQRMEQAELLLREGGQSISEVGRLVGYQDYHGRPPCPIRKPTPSFLVQLRAGER